MKTKKSFSDDRSGMTLMVVMIMTLLCAAAVSSVLFTVGARVQRAYKQVYLEQAFYIAEAGMERAAALVATGEEEDATLTDNIGGGSYVTTITCSPLTGGEIGIEVVSEGTINGTSRTVTVRGLRRLSWARYALWYDEQALTLNIAAGDTFRGLFYSRPLLRFSSPSYSRPDQAHFYDRAWTVQDSIYLNSGADPIFDQGLTFNAELQEISDVSLADLKAAAANNPNGLILDGETTIELDGSIMRVTNEAADWDEHEMPVPENGIVYATEYTYTQDVEYQYQDWEWDSRRRRYIRVWKTGTKEETVTEPGNITVLAPNGLDGQLTLVAEENINIADHIRYANNPIDDPDSDDKLGLIAGEDAIVKPSAPDDVDIFAHIFCRGGGFGVEDYNQGDSRGTLNVYGGIANLVRNAVGIVNGSGYLKNYVYDSRFSRNPPPYYPRLTDVLAWDGWEG